MGYFGIFTAAARYPVGNPDKVVIPYPCALGNNVCAVGNYCLDLTDLVFINNFVRLLEID